MTIVPQVINYILTTKNKDFIVLNNLDETYFPHFESVFNFIKNHIDTYGRVPDKATVLSRFSSDFENDEVSLNEMNDEFNEPESYLLEQLTKNRTITQVLLGNSDIKKAISNGNIEEIVPILEKTISNISGGTSVKSVDILKDTTRYNDYLKRIDNNEKFYIKTGFPELDKIIGGWDREEELATIVARSGQGKSWLGIKFALEAAKQGLRVGIYSGEMSEKKVGYRIDTLLGHIPNGSLIHGNEYEKNNYKTYIENLPKTVSGSILVLTPNMICGPAGVGALKSFIEREKLDLLVVDQHSLLEDDRHAKSPIEKAANISRDLKNLQVMEKIPIIAISQQNRTSTENGVGTEHVAQSDRIAQDSTIIIFIERDKKDKSIMRLELVKSRDSESGKELEYRVNLNNGEFIYCGPEEEDSTYHSNETKNISILDYDDEDF